MSIEKTNTGWRARWRDSEGHAHSKRFRLKTEAQAFMDAINTDKRRGTEPTEAAPITVRDLADQWLQASVHLAPRTQETYRRDLDRYILPEFGARRIDKVTPAAIQAWLSAELDEYASSSVHRHYRTIRTMYGWAIRMGLATRNPCDAVNAPRVERGEISVFTPEQVEAIADNISPRYRAMVLVAAYGGLRWSEIVGLRRRDIDGATIIVTRQLHKTNGTWTRVDTKTPTSRRRVTLPASVAEDLARHLEQFTAPEPDAIVFTNQHGRPTGQSFRNAWYRACAAAGMGERTVKNWRPAYRNMPRFHDLRHTAAALAIAAGAHPKAIQQRLGHSNIGTTMNTYGHLMAGMDEQLAAGIDALRPD